MAWIPFVLFVLVLSFRNAVPFRNVLHPGSSLNRRPLKLLMKSQHYDVAIIGSGSGGLATASSLLRRDDSLSIALIDPAENHYYQPGWTLVGAGVFTDTYTQRRMEKVIPSKLNWLKETVVGFQPGDNLVYLNKGDTVHYKQLIVAPGISLHWEGVKGLNATLGKNGVTSNYDYSLASYTWELVKGLKNGKAIFTQPPPPFKCAGAPQKAMYLSSDHWLRTNVLPNIDVEFYSAGKNIFGIPDYVPALQSYLDRYSVRTHFHHTLVEVDGPNKVAFFRQQVLPELPPLPIPGEKASQSPRAARLDAKPVVTGQTVKAEFDMLHVVPPQRAPAFVADSVLADSSGFLDVDAFTLQHTRFPNVWGVGDVINTRSAKTMAAVRKQAPVVAQNVIAALRGQEPDRAYDGYGSCPVTVERGKVLLTEFGYGGELMPSFPSFLSGGSTPSLQAWLLKEHVLPRIYWHFMLNGLELMVAPKELKQVKESTMLWTPREGASC